jgi:hypothetical protein
MTIAVNYNNSVALVHERTVPVELLRLSANLVPTSADTVCLVVSAADSSGRNVGFLERSDECVFKLLSV